MKPVEKIGWITIVFLAALSIALLIAAQLKADVPTLEDRLVLIQKPYQTLKSDPVDERALAHAIAIEAKGDRQLAALMLTMAAHESALSEHIRLGECRAFECDSYKDRDGVVRFKAWGLWQVHKNVFNSERWGSNDLQDQAHAAARILRGAVVQCRKSRSPFPISVFRAARGYGCELPLRGEERRAATYAQIMRRI